jgi:serine transporter
MLMSTWLVATFNPSILGIIEMLGGPIIAILLFLLPMYAIARVPSMARYRGALSNYFVWIIGIVALAAIVYKITP